MIDIYIFSNNFDNLYIGGYWNDTSFFNSIILETLFFFVLCPPWILPIVVTIYIFIYITYIYS